MRLAILPPLTVVLAVLAAAPAHGALPAASARYEAHDHDTRGDNWHVEVEVSKDPRRVRSVVLYAERCDGATTFGRRVSVEDDGRIVAAGEVVPGDARSGTWYVDARFVTRDRLKGVWRIVTPNCDTGAETFVARRDGDGHAGDGHAGHRQGGEHREHTSGPASGTMPDLEAASRTARMQAAALWRASRRVAARRFPTYAAARGQGYVRYPIKWRRPVIFHLRKSAYDRDAHVLDPERPESLVFWWPQKGKPVLIAFMYRAPAGRPPAFARPLLAWHAHVLNGRRGRTQMSHIWLTGGLRSGLANCLPVRQLEATIPAFRFEGRVVGAAHESGPCPDPVR